MGKSKIGIQSRQNAGLKFASSERWLSLLSGCNHFQTTRLDGLLQRLTWQMGAEAARIDRTVGLILAALYRLKRSACPQPPVRAPEVLGIDDFAFRRGYSYGMIPIFPQVAISALVGLGSQLSQRQQFAVRRRFGWEYCDFVICALYTLDILLIIELDGHTHDAGSDRKRDAMTRAAGYQTHRFTSKHKPTVAELADLFAKQLPTLKP